eukprot:scaffold179976_cov30-Tisochrysis_lutea.AAC.1
MPLVDQVEQTGLNSMVKTSGCAQVARGSTGGADGRVIAVRVRSASISRTLAESALAAVVHDHAARSCSGRSRQTREERLSADAKGTVDMCTR